MNRKPIQKQSLQGKLVQATLQHRKWKRWLIFLLVCIASFASIVVIQQRYTTMLEGGTEYQWAVRLERKTSWVPSDYLSVTFSGTRTTWIGNTPPVIGGVIYVSVGVQPNGMLYIKNASSQKPDNSEYIMANTVAFSNGIIDFSVPFNRVRVNLKSVDPSFYKNYKGVLLATLKIKDGEGVVTGVYAKGVPIEIAKPEENPAQNGLGMISLPGGQQTESLNDGTGTTAPPSTETGEVQR